MGTVCAHRHPVVGKRVDDIYVGATINNVDRVTNGRLFLLHESDAVELCDGEVDCAVLRVDEQIGGLVALETDVVDGIHIVVVCHRTVIVEVDMVVLCAEAYATKQEGHDKQGLSHSLIILRVHDSVLTK